MQEESEEAIYFKWIKFLTSRAIVTGVFNKMCHMSYILKKPHLNPVAKVQRRGLEFFSSM